MPTPVHATPTLPASPLQPGQSARRHDIDALRVIAMGLLIAYHVAMVYVADWGYHVKSGYQWEWLQWPMLVLNRWRMPLLFMVSGMALAMAMSGQPASRLLGSRSWRLLLPLVFGILAVVPVQAYCEARANGVVGPGFASFMLRYLQLRPWPEGGWSGAHYGFTWNHLWFLAYVWIYSALVLVLSPLLQSAAALRVRDWLAGRGIVAWVLVPAAAYWACLWWMMPCWPETHALAGDWFAHARYGGFFVTGWLFARHARFWSLLLRYRHALLVLALLSISVELALRAAGRGAVPEDLPAWALAVDWGMVERGARALYTWTALLAIFGWSQVLLNRPFRWLPAASAAVYPWYILHQSLIVPLAFALAPLALGPWLEPALVLAGTLAGCWLIHALLIRPFAPVRPLFGLPPRPRARPAHPSQAASRLATGGPRV